MGRLISQWSWSPMYLPTCASSSQESRSSKKREKVQDPAAVMIVASEKSAPGERALSHFSVVRRPP